MLIESNLNLNLQFLVFLLKDGTKGYTPDFFIPKYSSWIEIKGFLDAKSMTKIRRFKRYYKTEFDNFTFIISKYSTEGKKFAMELEIPAVIFYDDIRSYYSDKISTWEGK